MPPSRVDRMFRKLQLVSAAAFSLAHGTNDAQKTAGIITGVLVTSVDLYQNAVPPSIGLRSRLVATGESARRSVACSCASTSATTAFGWCAACADTASRSR